MLRRACVSLGLVFLFTHSVHATGGLAAPSLSAKSGPGSIALSWSDPNRKPNETGFRVKRRLQSQSAFSLLKTLPANSTSYSDASAAPGATFCYQVEVYRAGKSAVSNTACAAAPAPSATKVVGGESFTALLYKGEVYVWGSVLGQQNSYGEPDLVVPTLNADFGTGVKDIEAGPFNLCAIKSDDSMACIGDNDYLQMGQGTSAPNHYSTPVKTASGVKHMALDWYNMFTIDQNNQLRGWGGNYNGNFGQGTYIEVYDSAAAPLLATNIKDVSTSENATCILDLNGVVQCAGYNYFGECGSDFVWDQPAFTKVELPGPVARLLGGYYHTCARLVSGETYCWGYGGFAELGNGSTEQQNPVPQLATPIPTDADDVFVQNYRTCFLRAGELFCFGTNRDYILGDPSLEDWYSAAPVKVLGLHGKPLGMIENLSGQRGSNFNHACAITTAGIECWGNNYNGEVGNGSHGTYDVVSAPQLVFSLPSTAATYVTAQRPKKSKKGSRRTVRR